MSKVEYKIATQVSRILRAVILRCLFRSQNTREVSPMYTSANTQFNDFSIVSSRMESLVCEFYPRIIDRLMSIHKDIIRAEAGIADSPVSNRSCD